MTILFLPDYTDTNPYQSNLAAAMDTTGERIVMARNRAVLPLLRPVLARENVTVVHVHWFDPYLFSGSLPRTLVKILSTFLELLVVRLLGVAVVWTCHNVRSHESPYPRLEYLFKHTAVRFGLCDHMFVHCEATKDEFVEAYDLDDRVRSAMTVVSHGNYLDNYENVISRNTARADLGIETSGTVYLFFGMIRPYKGVRSLIEAFRSLDDPEARLVVAGKVGGGLTPEDILSAVGDDDRIETHLRFVPSERVQVFMNAADAVVLPLADISMSGSSMLALSFGRALVVPRVGCIPELIGSEGAVMYDPDRPGALAEALATAGRRSLEEMGEHNYRLARTNDWSTAAERTVDVYREVTDGAVSPGQSPSADRERAVSESPEK